MHISLILVESLNGKITNGSDPNIYSWTSTEDSDFFFSQISAHNLIIMGSTTYLGAKEKIRITPGTLRIVLTRTPQKYQTHAIPGGLEFSDESLPNLMQRLENQGYKNALVVGGSEVAGMFLNANLVNELFVTLEPLLFSEGTPFVSQLEKSVSLKLQSSLQINPQGTMLLQYTTT